MRERGGQLSEAAGINFLCELRITGDVQHAESGQNRHDSTWGGGADTAQSGGYNIYTCSVGVLLWHYGKCRKSEIEVDK